MPARVSALGCKHVAGRSVSRKPSSLTVFDGHKARLLFPSDQGIPITRTWRPLHGDIEVWYFIIQTFLSFYYLSQQREENRISTCVWCFYSLPRGILWTKTTS